MLALLKSQKLLGHSLTAQLKLVASTMTGKAGYTDRAGQWEQWGFSEVMLAKVSRPASNVPE